MERHRVDAMRDFMRLHLGDDWEICLILANAIADQDAPDEVVHAAQQRAVALVRAKSPGWRDDLSDLVAEARLSLWMEP